MLEGAIVAIEAASPPAPTYLDAAVNGCASALGVGRCIDAARIAGVSPEWRAIIRTSSLADPRVMVIEVRRRGTLFRRRILQFSDNDAVTTRWSTAGAVIAAALSGELDTAGTPEATNDAAPGASSFDWTPGDYSDDPIDVFEPEGPSPFEVRGVALELLGTSGYEVYEAPPEVGALLRAKLALSGGPFVFGGLGGTATPHNPLIVQSDGFVGLGMPLRLSPRTALDFGVSLVGEWLWFRHETASGQRDSGDQWRGGVGVDVDFRVRLTNHWAAVAGARATFLRPEVDIRRQSLDPDLLGRQVGIVLPAGLGMVLGVRYDFGDDSW